MSGLFQEYRRVDEETPCPKCGHSDWCLVANSGRKCVCKRVKSGKRLGEAGFIHYLPDGLVAPSKIERKPRVYLTTEQVKAYLDSIRTYHNSRMLTRQASILGVSRSALVSLYAHYDSDSAVTVFPMFDAEANPVGCRFRRADGKKWALKGGREGVFRSRGFDPTKTIWITEGPTDAASLIHIGYKNVLGRPSCCSGGTVIRQTLADYPDTPVIIIADNDPHGAGLDGAVSLADEMTNPTVVLLGPSDLREYISTVKVASRCRNAIIKAVKDTEGQEWRAAFYNRRGQYHYERLYV